MNAIDAVFADLDKSLDYSDPHNLRARTAEARAAVAELVEAAKQSQTAWESFYANDGENGSLIRLSAAFHREAAALARAGGAK